MTADGLKKKLLPMSETMFYILSSLRQERHGYGIMLHVKEITQGRIVLGAGTIYQTLQKLERDRLIRPTREIDRKKQYLITGLGEELLREEARRIIALSKLAEGLLLKTRKPFGFPLIAGLFPRTMKLGWKRWQSKAGIFSGSANGILSG